jgi:predicted transcriptional regulator
MLNATLDNSNIGIPKLDKVKDIILTCIYEDPGIRYREVLKQTGLSNGKLEYHLKALETRYYPLSFSKDELEVLNYIRKESAVMRIILFILDHGICTFKQIVGYANKAPSTIYWHIKRLKLSGIIVSIQYNRNLYKIANKDLMAKVLYKCKNSLTINDNQNLRKFDLI